MEERRRESDSKLHDLCVTVYGNGDVESRQKSLLGIVSGIQNSIKVNGWWVRGIVALIMILIIPVGGWMLRSERIFQTVEVNTQKWAALEPEHQTLIKDVEVLKEKSYGYRGIKVQTDESSRIRP